MANTIILKRSATAGKVPTTSQLALGEIAINTFDGRVFLKKDNGTLSVVEIGGVTSVNSFKGDVVLGSDDVAEGSNHLYFTNARARGAVSAGSGVSYNSLTGVISTTQNLTTTGTPTFAGLTLNGNVSLTGNIVPTADNVYSLGSPTMQWKDVYVGPGSLYVDGVEVIHSAGQTMNFSADIDQNMRITTAGTGVLQLGSASTVVQMAGTLQITSGKNITDSAGNSVGFGNAINMNSNKIVGLGAPSAGSDAATKTYVDSQVAAISTSTISQGNSNVQVIDTGTGTVNVTVDGTTALSVTAAGVVVAGNFTVNGTTTTVQSNTVAVADNILTLNSDTTGVPTQNAGVEIERGDEANVQLRWNEAGLKWTFTNDGAVYFPMAVSTTDLAEGTNQYFTTARARSAVSASTATGVSYNGSTGLISLGSIPNSSLTNSSITINGTAVSLGGTRTLGTDDVAEGSTNQYFTTARARSSVSAGTGISYNSTTGAISTTITQYTDALARGAVSAGTGLSYNSTTGVFTNTITQYTDALARGAVSATGDLAYNGTTGVFSFTQNKAFSALTGVPTTVAGYGITDAYTKTQVDSAITAAVALKDNTDEITEGTTNLYFTNARARGAVSVSGSLSYNSTTGVISYTTPSTSGITEGTNLYYTDARARGAVSAGTGISYNSTTGVFTNTITQYTDALARGAVSAGTGISYNSTTGVISTTITQYTDALARAAISAGTGISYNSTTGVVSNAGVTSLNGSTGAKTLSNFHAAFQTVTAAQATTNATATVDFTFADLSTAVHVNVFLNRMMLRPTEFTVSGSTLTMAIGTLASGDEIEVCGCKLA